MKDAANIGADKATQDPADTYKGTYKDNADGMSQAEKIDFMPKAPDPKPFKIVGGGSGSR